MRIALLISLSFVALAGCSQVRGGGPDASQVLTNQPLVIPSDLSQLPPPR